MAASKFIVKFFPEITIKSKPVRRQFATQLAANVRRVLSEIDPAARVRRDWDKLLVASEREGVAPRIASRLARVSGIACFLEVLEYPLGDFGDILGIATRVYGERLAGRTFAVRCKRAGRHGFRSVDVERHVGAGLLRETAAAGVDLGQPDVTVQLEIRDQALFVVKRRHRGLGGFPAGSLDPVLSLLSGGFDSAVASYLCMKRGLRTHFCFFSLGGREHESAVSEMALHLWHRYGCAQPVLFVSVPFEEVVAELLERVEDAQMGVLLKRMMLRAAARIAGRMRIEALVTGESVAQVSSQTLRNLAVIDAAVDSLVLRPLVATDKEEIIRLATEIGAAERAAAIPEYCGVISVNPTTAARREKVAEQEARFDFRVLERAVARARARNIRQLAEEDFERAEVEVLAAPLADSVIVDIRHPSERERRPLQVPAAVERIPFYELRNRAGELDRNKTYMLYCERGVISRLHAAHLVESGYRNVKVYRPGQRGAAPRA